MFYPEFRFIIQPDLLANERIFELEIIGLIRSCRIQTFVQFNYWFALPSSNPGRKKKESERSNICEC